MPTTEVMPPRSTAGSAGDIEKLLLDEKLVSEVQLDRARRIAAKMQHPKPLGEILVELGQLARSEHDRILQLHRASLDIAGILHDCGALSAEGLAMYRRLKHEQRHRTDRSLLLDEELVTEEQYLRALGIKKGIPYVEPEIALVDDELLARATFKYLISNKVLPVRVVEGMANVIMADPLNLVLIQELERLFQMRVRVSCCSSARLAEALRTLEHLKEKGGNVSSAAAAIQYREIEDLPAGEDPGQEAIQIVDYLICRALEMGASDLHIEPKARKVGVRVRVDGALQPLTELPVELAPRITSRVKILCGADIAERRLHQDGRIFVRVDGREVDLRVSTYVSMFGETLVLRLLDRNRGLVALDRLGFEPKVLSILQDVVLRASSGLVLVTGPTGSGKTTTLYSFIDSVLAPDLKVITCEDPVEYVLDDVIQCTVNEKSGPTFADSLRAILRQDPDIIVVGEVRDQKSANLAIEAALTGHKVFSTFHTEDAVSAVIRLLEMGVEPFLVSTTLSCVVAQRLMRRTCEHCRRPVEISRKDLRFLGLGRRDLGGLQVLEGAGCPKCGHTGYKGRLGVHEALLPDDDFRDAILRRAPAKELRALAKALPTFLTLQEDGLLKVAAGLTSPGEVADNVPRDIGVRPLPALREIASTRSLL